MAQSVNFENGDERFNIDLDADGNLNFNASGINGNGRQRMIIPDATGNIRVGGGGQFGALQLTNPDGDGVTFIGGGGQDEAVALLGGAGSGLDGRVQLGNKAGEITVQLRGGRNGTLLLGSRGGDAHGELALLNKDDIPTIQLLGLQGLVLCTDLTEQSDGRLKTGITPLLDTLNKVIALRGVHFQWKRADESDSGSESSEGSEIGFIGQEVENVYPELVTTDEKGYLSLNYSRLTAVLVEAVKEQQRLIQQQASALGEALQRIARIETALEAQST